jgi:DNA-binding transcriptional LysR family regulator
MEPTPHATELIRLLQEAEGLLQAALGHHVVFNPSTSDRRFAIYSTDIAQLTFMPTLMKRLSRIAPGVSIELRRISELTPKQLESGAGDLAIGFLIPMGAGYCQQRLFKEKFVCAVRRDHPRVRDTFELEHFLTETHVTVATCGTGHSILEKTLEANRIHRKVGLTIPSFLGIGPAINALDYVVTMPERLALQLAETENIKVFPLPIPVPSYQIVQHWHERYTHDPANKWLRALIAELFTSSRAAAEKLTTEPKSSVRSLSTGSNRRSSTELITAIN